MHQIYLNCKQACEILAENEHMLKKFTTVFKEEI